MRSFACLEDFGEDASFPLIDGLQRLCARLRDSPNDGKLGFVVCVCKKPIGFILNMDNGKVKHVDDEGEVRRAGCVVIVWLYEDVLRLVLRGVRSPLDALINGQLRYAGRDRKAIELLRAIVTDPSDILAPCRELGDFNHACR